MGANLVPGHWGRVILPPRPAIVASAVLVFSGVIDDFVIVDLLPPTPGKPRDVGDDLYTQRGGNGGPPVNASATIIDGHVVIIAIIGYTANRFQDPRRRAAGSRHSHDSRQRRLTAGVSFLSRTVGRVHHMSRSHGRRAVLEDWSSDDAARRRSDCAARDLVGEVPRHIKIAHHHL